MNNRTFAALALMLLFGGFLLGRYCYHATEAAVATSRDEDNRYLDLDERTFSGRTLIVLVDGPDIYIGEDRAPKEEPEAYIAERMKQHHAKSFMICGSISARYGDVVTLIARLKKKGLKLATISPQPVRSGARLDLFADNPPHNAIHR